MVVTKQVKSIAAHWLRLLLQTNFAFSCRLRHRGPDWSGIHVHGNNFLAHERLAIVDPTSGDQPLYNTNKDVIVTVRASLQSRQPSCLVQSAWYVDGACVALSVFNIWMNPAGVWCVRRTGERRDLQPPVVEGQSEGQAHLPHQERLRGHRARGAPCVHRFEGEVSSCLPTMILFYSDSILSKT